MKTHYLIESLFLVFAFGPVTGKGGIADCGRWGRGNILSTGEKVPVEGEGNVLMTEGKWKHFYWQTAC
jgi:hypothetical protein